MTEKVGGHRYLLGHRLDAAFNTGARNATSTFGCALPRELIVGVGQTESPAQSAPQRHESPHPRAAHHSYLGEAAVWAFAWWVLSMLILASGQAKHCRLGEEMLHLAGLGGMDDVASLERCS